MRRLNALALACGSTLAVVAVGTVMAQPQPCGPMSHLNQSCGGVYHPACTFINCEAVVQDPPNTCKNAAGAFVSYNAFRATPNLSLATCQGTQGTCTDRCFTCTTTKYNYPPLTPPVQYCAQQYLVCTETVITQRACQ